MSTPSRDREPGGGRPGMRKRKETKYREGSESSGSDGARKSAAAEKKRDQRRRQKAAKKNLEEEQSTSATGTTNPNFRANEAVQTPRTRQQSRLQTETPERTIKIEQDISAIIEVQTPRTGPQRKCRTVTPARDEPQPGPSNLNLTSSGRPQRKRTVKKEVAVEVQEIASRNIEEPDPTSPPEEETPSPMDSDDSDYFNSQKQKSKTPHQKAKRKQQLSASQKRIRDRLEEDERRRIQDQNTGARQEQRERLEEEERTRIQAQDAEAHQQQRASQTPHQRGTVNQIRRTTAANPRRQLRIARDHDEEIAEHYCGTLSEHCSHCWAFYFKGEQSKKPDGTYNPCCKNGKVTLSLFPSFPEELRNLFTGNDPSSRKFFENIRQFNTSLSFASMECQMQRPAGRGPYVFKVHGEIRHFTSSAEATTSRSPSYGQLFFIDETVAVDHRLANPANKSCDPMIMSELSRIIRENHEFAREFQMLRDVYKNEETKARQEGRPMHNVRLVFQSTRTPDSRRYNAPRVPEVAVVYVGPEGEVPNPGNYVINARGGGLHKIPLISRILDPSTYPLFFLTTEFGWHPNIPLNGVRNRQGEEKHVSQKNFYCWYLSVRDVFNPVHYGRRLFQQFVVGSWVNTEQCRLDYIRRNQSELRSEFYNDVRSFIADGGSGAVGSKILLPASFTSSPRYMLAQYQDAMSIVARFGKPDLFLTFTCNPKWTEITENLKDGQSASDRPDLVARVFRMKLNELIKDIWDRKIFGTVTAYIYTVEWQKRGLPHAHMLITLASSDKPHTPEDVDSLISAEIPEHASRLKELVAAHMIHRDCGPGSPCWVDGKCSKRFPKEYQDETDMDNNSYPAYKRRDTKFTVSVGNPPKEYDNQWVVPHSPYLLLKYNAHINLEICSVIHATKYLYKYVYKGSDKARLEMRQQRSDDNGVVVDEIAEHLDARYVCAPEAFHRLFAFKLHDRSHPVIELAVHEENRHTIYFQQGEERRALERNQTTTLLAYFKFNRLARELKARNQIDELGPVDPNTVLYSQFPEHFTYDKPAGIWRRKLHANRNIGRIHSVYPAQRERYSIRMLLLHKPGDCSFAELFTVDGEIHQTAHDAAIALGIIQTEDHFNRAMKDADFFKMPTGLRSVFACLLAFDGTSMAEKMFEKWKKEMSEDYKKFKRYSEQECFALAYYDIADMCIGLRIRLQDFITPPLPSRPPMRQQIRSVDHRRLGDDMYSNLNRTQLTAVNAILSEQEKLVFLDGPGGSGKTYTYECIYHKSKANGKNVVCLAWTGIAANLLPEGRTVASFFKLNINDNCASSHLKPNTMEGRQMKDIDIFIIDEVSMISNKVIDTIDRTLRDMTQVMNLPFGGKTVLIGGDFRQVLPIPNSLLGQTSYQCCLKNASQFSLFRTYHLTENMRAATASAEFKNFLLSIGEDTAEKDEEGRIEIPADMMSNGDLIDEVFEGGFDNADELSTRAILSPKNVNVDEMNSRILSRMQGDSKLFYSVDSIEKQDSDSLQLSDEFLHSLRPSDLPPHKLELKIGCIVMLIRNLNVKEGLCNGTRLQVHAFGRMNAIQCTFINGVRKGDKVIIPRIDLKSSKGKGMSFVLTRRQFPFKLAFAMTINKAQGQSLERVGIHLPSEVFSHGQLYVALSRAKTSQGIKVSIPEGRNRTMNVVDTRVL